MITVYHNADFLNVCLANDETLVAALASLDQSKLTKVAEVGTDSLDDAYRRTNHIDGNWTENEGVKAPNRQVRSTSVGDVMESGGKRYVVARCGFVELP